MKEQLDLFKGSSKKETNRVKRKILSIYTDGACSGNGKDGARAGWGFVVVNDGGSIVYTRYGRVKRTQAYRSKLFHNVMSTNNSGELMAIYEALGYCVDNRIKNVNIFSDSQYCINSLTKWDIEKRRKGRLKANYNLIKEIKLLLGEVSASFYWVKGHEDNFFNNMADELATGSLI